MRISAKFFYSLVAAVSLSLGALAVVLGQQDTFEDGSLQGWFVGSPGHPFPPTNVPDGGPRGLGDNYLWIRSVGGGGPGSRLAVINDAQWAGNYTGAGVNTITMSVKNLGDTDLSVRLLFERISGGVLTDYAETKKAALLPVGSGWRNVSFRITPSDLSVLRGSAQKVLGDATQIRIFHNVNLGFPPPPFAGSLGIDNIRARFLGPIPTAR